MDRAGMVFLLIASGTLGTLPEKPIVAQESTTSFRPEANPKVGIASLKICLRLQSATFIHNGEAGSVKVDVFLVQETTLDLIPETPLLEND